MTMRSIRRPAAALSALLALAACGDDVLTPGEEFLRGTDDDRQIGLVVNSTNKSLTLFQLADPANRVEVALGTSSAVTPVSFSSRGSRAAVPLGNASSVALVDLSRQEVARYFLFRQGNTTGSAWADDNTVLAANTTGDFVGRFTLDQASDSITQTVEVAPAPTAIVVTEGRAFVVSGNLDDNYSSLGNGVVTVLNPRTLAVERTLNTGGTNSSAAAVGPDGLVYVLNTGDYVADASVTVIDPRALTVVREVGGFIPGSGSISIDERGLMYVSAFFGGTTVYNTATRTFVRGQDNPLCAPFSNAKGEGCRGAFDAVADERGRVFQLFFGSTSMELAPKVFVYAPTTFALTDSIATSAGPADLEVRRF